MDYSFEKEFSAIQSNMVSVCIWFIKDLAEKIYIWLSHERRLYSFNCFFQIHGRIVTMGYVPNALQPGDPPFGKSEVANQDFVLRTLVEEDMKLIKLFKANNRELPTQIQLIYDVTTRSLEANYRYDKVFSKDPQAWPDIAFRQWMKEEADKLGTEVIDVYHVNDTKRRE